MKIFSGWLQVQFFIKYFINICRLFAGSYFIKFYSALFRGKIFGRSSKKVSGWF